MNIILKENTDRSNLPFLKWPGGKRWAALRISRIVSHYLKGTYYEPFLGGGAVFFHLQPDRAVLSDINEELVNTYKCVQHSFQEIINILKEFEVSSTAYYKIREWNPENPIDLAARFLYLNRTAFGGIYRLNKKGRFNVPYGGGERTPETLWKRNLLKSANSSLAKISIEKRDFEVTFKEAIEGDVIYCDPTYTVVHNSNAFIRYNERNFSWQDQTRLAEIAVDAAKRGVVILVSNAHHKAVRNLYPNVKKIILKRKSLVSRNIEKRGLTSEYLFVLKS